MEAPNHQSWLAACKKEIDSISEKHVWTILHQPSHRHVIGGRWVSKVKLNVDGLVSKFKARYVAKGYTQVGGVDYHETFSPTGKPASFLLLVAIAPLNGWYIEQMDAIMACLKNELAEEIYIKLPEGFSHSQGTRKVTKLHKSLYGLKQSARIWSNNVCKFLVYPGFKIFLADACVYICQSESNFSAV